MTPHPPLTRSPFSHRRRQTLNGFVTYDRCEVKVGPAAMSRLNAALKSAGNTP